MEAAVGEYRQPECNSFSDPQPVKTLWQWADVVTSTGGEHQLVPVSGTSWHDTLDQFLQQPVYTGYVILFV